MIAELNSGVCEAAAQIKPYSLKKIVIAHDASVASERALTDAAVLAKRYGAELIVAHVQTPLEFGEAEDAGIIRSIHGMVTEEVSEIAGRLREEGIRSRGAVREGSAGDTLFHLCCEEKADLLLMGAYGHHSQDRQKLGSTAEQLLRGVPCPVLTYGPNVAYPVISGRHSGPICLPVSLPFAPSRLADAVALAKLFGEQVEVFHAAARLVPQTLRWFEEQCLDLASFLRENGVSARWTLVYGQADRLICAQASEMGSPFILMPLKWRKGLSSAVSGNVAAHVIRQSRVPVLTFRCD